MARMGMLGAGRTNLPVAWALAAALQSFAPATAVAADPAPPAEAEDGAFRYVPVLKLDRGGEQIEAAIRQSALLFTLAEQPLDSAGILFSRAKSDRVRIARALNALGYFAPKVGITIEGLAIDDPANEDALAAKPPATKFSVEVTVAPGTRFVFGALTVAPAEGSAAEPLGVLGTGATGLAKGAPARSADVGAAEKRIVAALRAKGYPYAAVAGREATADHATATLDIVFRVAPGPLATFGTVAVKGNDAVKSNFIARLAPFAPGEPYAAATLDDYKTELERLAVFSNVAIEEGKELDASGRLPVTAAVTERKQHAVGIQASWSTLEGAAIGGYWLHRNLWGEAEQLRIDATSARLLSNGADDFEYGLTAALTLPAEPSARDDIIVTVGLKRERPDAYERDAAFAELRLRRRFDKTLHGEAAIGFTQSRETDALGTRNRSTLNAPVTFVYDTRDNILDPTKGWRLTAGVDPIFNLAGGSAFAGRFDATASAYRAIGSDTIVAGRVALGVSAADDVADLPVDLRFYAGGGGSVRGYEYQALSPRNAVNQITGGRSLIEGSVELRSWLWDDIGAAAFVDAGAASDANTPRFDDIGVGVGLGLRYRTGLGPLRLDVALPLDPPAGDAQYGVYVALGQAF